VTSFMERADDKVSKEYLYTMGTNILFIAE
jgi:hypothetical protein